MTSPLLLERFGFLADGLVKSSERIMYRVLNRVAYDFLPSVL